MKLGDILSKPVLSLYNGTNEGTVLTACFDKELKKLKSLIIISENKTDFESDEEYVLDAKRIFGLGTNAITIKNNSHLELLSNIDTTIIFNSPINSEAYYIDGSYVGKITDVELDEKLNITQFVIQDNMLPNVQLASYSPGTIIFYNSVRTCNVKKMKPIFAKPRIETEQKVETFAPITKLSQPETINQNIQKRYPNSSILVGKKATKTILTPNGEVLIKKGQYINAKTITLIASHQKLRELAFHSE